VGYGRAFATEDGSGTTVAQPSRGGSFVRSVLRAYVRPARHTARESGAAAVEFALLFPVFMVMAMGIIATGVAFSKQINVTQAAREASRYGATYDYQAAGISLDAWLMAVDKAARQAAGASNDPMGGYDYRCVALVTTDPTGAVVSSKSRYMVNGGTSAPGSCPEAKSAPISSTDYVQVAIYRKSQFFALFINPTIKLDSVSITPYEGKAVP
jgi:Flp pilus assembly pilin Flp